MTESVTLTSALEDYLETIYELVRDNNFARVKDIAKARGVKSGSVTPAMKRLADLGLIKYVQREYINLTELGEVEARRIYAKHQMLTRFFEFLGMDATAAKADACAMEHSLSEEGMDRLTHFFEYMRACPGGQSFRTWFHQCPITHGGEMDCTICSYAVEASGDERAPTRSIADLTPGDHARVKQVNGSGAIRQRLLDMGILPDTLVEVERIAPTGDPIWIKVQGFQLSLRQKEAAAVLVWV